MKNTHRVLLALIMSAAVLAVTLAFMVSGYSNGLVTVSLDDCGGKLSGLRLRVEYFGEEEKIGADVTVGSGESVSFLPQTGIGNEIHNFVSEIDIVGSQTLGDSLARNGYGLYELCHVGSKGSEFCGYALAVYSTADECIPLGGVELTFPYVEYELTENKSDEAFIERLSSDTHFNCYYIDEKTGSIMLDEIKDGSAVSSRRLGDSGLDGRRLEWISGGEGMALIGASDSKRIYLYVADGEKSAEYAFDKKFEGVKYGEYKSFSVQGIVSDGVAVFKLKTENRIRLGGESVYIAMNRDGELLAKGSCEIPTDPTGTQIFTESMLTFDAKWDGEWLYVIDNSYYTLDSYVSNEPERHAQLLNEYGCGLPGYLVSVMKIGKDTRRAEVLHPIRANFSVDRRIYLRVSFAEG